MAVDKPILPKLDLDNSLTSGLVFDAQLYEGTGTTALDLANNVSGAFANSPAWGSRTPYGKVVTFADNTNIINYVSIAAQNSISAVSVEALVYPTGVNAVGDSRYVHKGSSSKYFSMAYNTTNKFELSVFWTTTEGDWDTPAFPINNWYHVVATYSYSAVTNVPIIYVNAVAQTLTVASNPTGSGPTDTTDLNVGNRNVAAGAAKAFVGDVAYVRYWNRILSSTEVGQLCANPWRIYQTANIGNAFRHISVGNGMGRSEGAT